MTALTQSLPTFDEVVALGCFKDAAIVEKIKRRGRHGTSEISRDFVVLPEHVKDRDLPRDLITRTRLRSHLRADSDSLVKIEAHGIILGEELVSIQESLRAQNPKLELTVPHARECTYIRDGVDFKYLIIRISRAY